MERTTQWVKKELSFSMDIWKAVTTLEEPDTDKWTPKVPKDENDVLAKAIFAEEVKEYMLRKRTYQNNR